MTGEIRQLNQVVRVLSASENPLSADVAFVKTTEATVIFDVGACDEALKIIEDIDGPRIFVISHFHADHMVNMSRIGLRSDDVVYGGTFTCKKFEKAIPVLEAVRLPLSEEVRLIPLPSSHSKGALAMECGDLAFLGDGTYPGKGVYNVSLLSQTIKIINSLTATKLVLSHEQRWTIEKNEILSKLKDIYAHRSFGDAYIDYKNLE